MPCRKDSYPGTHVQTEDSSGYYSLSRRYCCSLFTYREFLARLVDSTK